MGEQNENRAEWAREAVEAFPAQADDMETTIKDLLCDLMHLCDEEKIDFNRLLAGAQMCYQGEVDDDE